MPPCGKAAMRRSFGRNTPERPSMNSGRNILRLFVRNRLVFLLFLTFASAAAAQTTAPSRRPPKLPVVNLSVDAKSHEEQMEHCRQTLDHGRDNSNPLSARLNEGT